jgi:hypothetical protein
LSEMTRNASESEFRTFKMATGVMLTTIKVVFKNLKRKGEINLFVVWNRNKCKWRWISNIENDRHGDFSKKIKFAFYSEMVRHARESEI